MPFSYLRACRKVGVPNIVQRKSRSILRKPTFQRSWFIPLWCLLGLSRAAILTLSFRRIAAYLGSEVGISAWVPLLDSRQERRALQIGKAIRLAARYTPWTSNCFPQAMAARVLLSFYRIPYSLYFGLMRDSETGEFKAHAWVAAGRVSVTGGTSFDQFTVVRCFISQQLIDA